MRVTTDSAANGSTVLARLSRLPIAMEPIEPFDAAGVRRTGWLSLGQANKYIGYLQQYSPHTLNLLVFLLEADQEQKTKVESVSLDADGMTGLSVLQFSGIRCTLETASNQLP